MIIFFCDTAAVTTEKCDVIQHRLAEMLLFPGRGSAVFTGKNLAFGGGVAEVDCFCSNGSAGLACLQFRHVRVLSFGLNVYFVSAD